MIKLNKTEKPAILINNFNKWTQEYLENQDSTKKRYNHPDIKNAVLKETHDKCAYCESKVSHISFGDIEHILPKSKFPELYVEWNNLTFACEKCNRSGKKDYYDEALPLINPYIDNPEDHFYEFGQFIFPKLNDSRAAITIDVIELNRSSLIERRAERIGKISILLRAWNRESNDVLKNRLYEQIIEECREDKEYTSTVKSFLRASQFPF